MGRALHFTLQRASHTKEHGLTIDDMGMESTATGMGTVIKVTSKKIRRKGMVIIISRMGTATLGNGNTISRMGKVGTFMRMAGDMKVYGSEMLNMDEALISLNPVITMKLPG